jgi:hypothetical protein
MTQKVPLPPVKLIESRFCWFLSAFDIVKLVKEMFVNPDSKLFNKGPSIAAAKIDGLCAICTKGVA